MAGYVAHTGNCVPRFVEDLLSLVLVRTLDTRTKGSMLSVSRAVPGFTDSKSESLIELPLQ